MNHRRNYLSRNIMLYKYRKERTASAKTAGFTFHEYMMSRLSTFRHDENDLRIVMSFGGTWASMFDCQLPVPGSTDRR